MDYRDTVRRLLATLAFRTRRALQDTPVGFEDFDAGMGVRTPTELLNHMNMGLALAHDFYRGQKPQPVEALSFIEALEEFHLLLQKLDVTLDEAGLPDDDTCMRVLQGPLSDTLTHVGQLMMLRRLAGSSIPAANFFRAEIKTGVLGPQQALPRA
jgi:hypothetical protein